MAPISWDTLYLLILADLHISGMHSCMLWCKDKYFHSFIIIATKTEFWVWWNFDPTFPAEVKNIKFPQPWLPAIPAVFPLVASYRTQIVGYPVQSKGSYCFCTSLLTIERVCPRGCCRRPVKNWHLSCPFSFSWKHASRTVFNFLKNCDGTTWGLPRVVTNDPKSKMCLPV